MLVVAVRIEKFVMLSDFKYQRLDHRTKLPLFYENVLFVM